MTRNPYKGRQLLWFPYISLILLYGFLSLRFDWSGLGTLLVLAGYITLLVIASPIVKYFLHQELRKRFNPFRNPFIPLPKVITQYDVNIFLEATAWRLESLTKEQREAALDYNTLVNDFTRANLLVINEWVADALKYFWRAHWLARVFGYETKPRWKDYLPTKNA